MFKARKKEVMIVMLLLIGTALIVTKGLPENKDNENQVLKEDN